jgi:Uncharacterized conserved protein
MRKSLTNKVLILGIDGMDPHVTKKYLKQGKMPNVQKYIERGSCREDLVMLGGLPTGTPPMWTTLATGCNPNVHGITCFNRASEKGLDYTVYNLDSRNCYAEPLWNVFAEKGKKTLVWHWPGSSWPPTSDSPNLHVVDGTQPCTVNMGVAEREPDFLIVADKTETEVTYRSKVSEVEAPCTVTDLEVEKKEKEGRYGEQNILLTEKDGSAGFVLFQSFETSVSPIKPASGWANAPEDAKEFILLFSHGNVRRMGLILKNNQGIYEKVAIYKSKKDTDPITVLDKNVLVKNIIDESIKNDVKYNVSRNMRMLDLEEDGSKLRIWVSAAMDINVDSVFHPKRLYKSVVDNVGYPPGRSTTHAYDPVIVTNCMLAEWDAIADWQAASIQHLIAEEEYDVIFSHLHNVDAQLHSFVRFLKPREGFEKLTTAMAEKFLEDVYVQTDNYLGKFLHYLDEGWTVFIISDHALVCAEHERPQLGDGVGINIGVMRELGFTEVLKDANGNDIKAIDWSKTKAIASRANHIYINLKGRDAHGIVEPEDKYELEEEIMTALYGYRHKISGKRVVAMALRNKDAIPLGMGGPECGDILYWTAEGYNDDHFDGLATCQGTAETSLSPIFIGAGPGLKSGFNTERIIRQVDFAPTVASITGVRMPKQCEGAPVYQILEQEDF